MNARFLAIASDPRIIPGVHRHCDEWCDYCPVTSRCLAFRCMADYRRQEGRSHAAPPFPSLEAAVTFTRELAAIDGTPTEELDAILANPVGQSDLETSDLLASVAWEYAIEVTAVLAAAGREAAIAKPKPCGPAPEEVVAWYHLRIYLRVVRALISREKQPASSDALEDAIGSAKLALVSIERSRNAWRSLRTATNDVQISSIMALLDAVAHGLDERFPSARSFLRIGLDCPAAETCRQPAAGFQSVP
jgi:hypothetical protein